MRESEKKLYEREAEIRPNRYVSIALVVLSFFIIMALLLTEGEVFKVIKSRMRFCAFAALIILEIPLFISSTPAGLRNSRTKYLMVGSVGLATMLICTVLNFHVTLILILPVLLAAQYPHTKMCHIAMICSLLCAFFAPLISYLAGVWEIEFIEWICRISGRTVLMTDGGTNVAKATALIQIIIYLSAPHTLILLAFYPLSVSIAHSGEMRLKNQIQVLHMGESDALTGLLNRTSFEQIITQEALPEDGNVAVVYIDANDLHRLNNERGHTEGDRMLRCIADGLRDAFGNESVYRTGGDEFIAILHGMSLTEVRERMGQVAERAKRNRYSFAMGIEYAQPPCTLPILITAAESKMQMDKEKYHIVR